MQIENYLNRMMLADTVDSMTLTLITAITYYPPAPTPDSKTNFILYSFLLLPRSASPDIHAP